MPHENSHLLLRGSRGVLRHHAAQDRLFRKAQAAGGGSASPYILKGLARNRWQLRRSDPLPRQTI